MLQKLGLQYATHYAGALGGVGDKGKKQLGQFFKALNSGSVNGFEKLFGQGALIQCTIGQDFLHPEQFWTQYQLGEESWQLADKLLSAGRHSIARFLVKTATGEEQQRVLIIDFAERDLKIESVHCFDAMEAK